MSNLQIDEKEVDDRIYEKEGFCVRSTSDWFKLPFALFGMVVSLLALYVVLNQRSLLSQIVKI